VRTTNALSISAVVGATVTFVGLAAWSRMASWGATDHEVHEVLPGDDLVGSPKYRSTHAVTIDAAVEEVWPWIAQMGQGRGGLYSYDWLENVLGLNIHSAERIVPELQHLAVGDVIRMVPEGMEPALRFAVLRFEVPHLMVLGPASTRQEAIDSGLPFPFWTFRLTAFGGGRTRLVVRFQSDFADTPLGWVTNSYLLRPVHFVMERKMLLGIRHRAELGS
jgi:hypothetical protein